MYKEGTTTLTEDLTLKDFTWDISNIFIDVENKEVKVEVLMWEKHHRHSRVFTFKPAQGTSTFTKIVDLINIAKTRLLTMPMFQGSTE
jgi:hypothetical protein